VGGNSVSKVFCFSAVFSRAVTLFKDETFSRILTHFRGESFTSISAQEINDPNLNRVTPLATELGQSFHSPTINFLITLQFINHHNSCHQSNFPCEKADQAQDSSNIMIMVSKQYIQMMEKWNRVFIQYL